MFRHAICFISVQTEWRSLMANIQAAMPAKFLQVAGENKLIAKEGLAEKAGTTASHQLTSFLGVLKSQMSKPDALPEGLTGIQPDMPTDLSSKATLLEGASKESASKALLADLNDDAGTSEAVAPMTLAELQTNKAAPAPVTTAAAVAASAPITLAALQTNADAPVTTVPAVFSLSANMVSPKTGAVPPQETESDATAAQDSEIAGLTSIAGTKTEAAIRAGEAAIAAVAGQALPQGKSSAKSSDSKSILNAPVVQSKRDEAASNDAKSAFDIRLDASATATSLNGSASTSASSTASLAATTASIATPTVATSNNPIALAHPFDQAIRQAETRINAAIETSVRSPAFAAELGDKVVWLASRQGQFAELSLNPPQMGALEVRLNLSGSGDASAQFFSPNPIVREAIDAALPRLREMLAQAGINLGEAEVREHAFGRREQSDMRGQNPAQEAEIALHQSVMAGVGGARSAGVGLVDLYI
jgi:flagellar hook-length control protein FliK